MTSGKSVNVSTSNGIVPETSIARISSVCIEDENANKQHKSYKRANTNVGIMNKFILQFTRINEAYRMIEEAFLNIVGIQSQRSLEAKMILKCKVSLIHPILQYIGFTHFSNEEILQIFNKNITQLKEEITFQRVLIGIGMCYFKIQKKLEKHSLENSDTEIEMDSKGNIKDALSVEWADVIEPIDDEDIDDDSKISNEQRRYAIIKAGFKVVKAMFDTIDIQGNGEISSKEFEMAFNQICKDPIIVKARMKELDYNSDDQISLNEFVFGIAAWVGFNDDMEADENDTDLDQ